MQSQSTDIRDPFPPAGLARHATWALLVAALVALVAGCWLVDFERILRRTPDDTYYFFQIAENVAKGRGPTFDGIHLTSGFQPLWLLSLVPVFWVCPDSLETAVRMGLTMQAGALFLAGLLIVSVLSRTFSWNVVLGVVIVYTFSVFVVAVNGMETAIELLALAALFAFGFHAKVFLGDSSAVGKKWLFGMLLGVVMLARLDTVFLGAAIMAFLTWPAMTIPGRRLRNLAGPFAVFAGASLVVLPYLLYNHLTFGKMGPISGTLKSSFPHPSPLLAWQALRSWVGLPKMAILFAILVFAVFYLVWYLAVARKDTEHRDARFYFHTSMAVMACSILLHALHTILFMKWAIWTWHFFPYFLFASLAIAAPLERWIATRLGRATYGWAAAFLVLAGVLGNFYRLTATGSEITWPIVSYRAALWAREHTSPSDVFALKDTGNFGFFSQRRVINLDGVVNTLEFQDVLNARRLRAYFQENHVKYLVLHSTVESNPGVFDQTYETDSATYRSNLYGTMSDPIALRRSGEVYRATYTFPVKDDFVIWDISSGMDTP